MATAMDTITLVWESGGWRCWLGGRRIFSGFSFIGTTYDIMIRRLTGTLHMKTNKYQVVDYTPTIIYGASALLQYQQITNIIKEPELMR